MGALTLPLLKKTGDLTVVELDRDVIPLLKEACKNLGILHVHQADALTFDFRSLVQEQGSQRLRLVGNLPYNISTPLLFHLFTQLDCIQDMHFMLQKEVVDRMSAVPGNKVYGRLSVMVQYFCKTETLLDVPPEAFNPPPKVMSAVVRLVPHRIKPFIAQDEALLEKYVRIAFNHRRKTIQNNLKGLISSNELIALGIDPNARAENLSVEDFVKLVNFPNQF